MPKQSLVRSRDQEQKDNQKQAFDRHHGVRKLTDLSPGDTVWLPERQQEATVEDEVAPESYALVTSEGGSYRRNRQAINKLPDPSPQVETATDTHPASPRTLPRRSSRESNPPFRYGEFIPCSSYTMPTRGVSRIHEAIINKPEGVARGFIDYC